MCPALQRIRLAVADENHLYRLGFTSIVAQSDRLQCVAEADSVEELLLICKLHRPEILVLDAELPKINEAVAVILPLYPRTKIIILISPELESLPQGLLQFKLSAVVSKTIQGAGLMDVIEKVAAGECYVSPELASTLFASRQEHGRNG